jgi:selenocysteine lyase/cysteine desulfurase
VRNIFAHERELIDAAAGELVRTDRVRVFRSEYGRCQGGVLSFLVDGVPCETVGEELSRRGICVRTAALRAPGA